MKIGRITLIDPTAPAAQQDKYGPETEQVISDMFEERSQFVTMRVPHDRGQLRAALIQLCDVEKCPFVLTIGGTGPAATDFTPDVTLEILDREFPGFGEMMRRYSYERVKMSVLSRATAGVRGRSLIINLPGRPKAVKFCLRMLEDGIAEALDKVADARPGMRGDEIVVPLEKYLPFLKVLRVKPDPRGEHPTL